MSFWDIASILNKFIPGRKEKAINELHLLEKELADALLNNDDMRVSVIRDRLRRIREVYPDTDE